MSEYQSTAFASQRLWGVIGGGLAALAIVLGAYGDHGLRRHLNGNVAQEYKKDTSPADTAAETSAAKERATLQERLDRFRTGTQYHMFHSIAIILVGLLGRRGKARIVGFAAAACFITGILLFSGGLYVLAVTGIELLSIVVPFGGTLFIAGWILFAFAAGMPRTTRHS